MVKRSEKFIRNSFLCSVHKIFKCKQLNYRLNCLCCHSFRLLENGAKLQIDSAHLIDAGVYTCQMSNVAGQLNVTYQLDVFSRNRD